MATNFPASLDSLTNPTSSDSLNSPSHSAQHANVNDAVEALQVKVGIDSSADTSSLEYRIAQLEAAGSPIVKVAAFTSSGTWTVPSGVTYAIAHMLGGGGGGGAQTVGSAGDGGDSSVGFASGTVTAPGGLAGLATQTGGVTTSAQAANSGRGGQANFVNSGNSRGFDAQWVVAGAAVTPGASITVTVGAAGSGGTGGNAGGDGGSGYVWIEYQES